MATESKTSMTHFTVTAVVTAKDAGTAEARAKLLMEPFNECGEWSAKGTRWDWWVIGGRFDHRWPRNVLPVSELLAAWNPAYWNEGGMAGGTVLTDDGNWHEASRPGWWGTTIECEAKTEDHASGVKIIQYGEDKDTFAARLKERFLDGKETLWALCLDVHV